MPLLLHIETSTPQCSVTLAKDEKIISTLFGDTDNDHIAQLTLLIDKVFHTARCELREVDAIAVSAGPGSYTGLRIGFSTAKGICHALSKPMITIGTLESMTEGAKKILPYASAMYCPLIDARRMEVFTMLSRYTGEISIPPQAMIIDDNAFEIYRDQTIIFFGSGVEKCRPMLKSSHYHFIDAFLQSSEYLVGKAHQAYVSGIFSDVAYSEPMYLKPVYTTQKR